MSDEEVTFEQALSLDAHQGGSCRVQISEAWAQGRATFGGLVAALLVRALERALPPERNMRSCVVDFVAPVAPGEATIQASVLRAGRALTHGEARISQNGAVCAIMVAAYGERRSTSIQIDAPAPPAIDPPEALTRFPYVAGVMPRFTSQFDFRIPGGRFAYMGAPRANFGGYVGYPGGGPSDAAGILGLLDAWPAPVLAMLNKFAPASTVTWMVDMVAELPARGARSDAFFRYESAALAAGGGYASHDARLWSPDGQLLALSRQMVVEFS